MRAAPGLQLPPPHYCQQAAASNKIKFSNATNPTRDLSVTDRMRAAFQMGSGKTVRETADLSDISKSAMGRLRQVASGSITPEPQIRDNHLQQFKQHFVAYAFLAQPNMTAQGVADLAGQFALPISAASVNRLALSSRTAGA